MRALLPSARKNAPLSALRMGGGPVTYPDAEKVPSNVLKRPVRLSPMRRVKT